MRSIDRVMILVFIGIVTSLVPLLFTPWMMHFLPTVALVHALGFGVLFGVVAAGNELLPEHLRSYGLVSMAGLFGLYLGGWFATRSRLSELGGSLRWVVTAGVILCLVLIFGRLFWWMTRIVRIRWYVSLVLIAGVLAVKVGGLSYLSAETLMTKHPTRSATRAVLNPGSDGLQDVLYPFSDFLHAELDRFAWLVQPDSGERHIFFLLLDGFRGDYLGKTFHGESLTPALDTLVADGMSFPQYRVQSSWTKPSTASLFTGRYPNGHGTIYGGGDESYYAGHVLPEKFLTLGERLKRRGYSNFGAVMSAHISSGYNYDQGFGVWLSPGSGYDNDFFTMNQALFWQLKEAPSKSFSYLHVKGPHQPFRLAYENRTYWDKTSLFSEGVIQSNSRFSFRSTGIVHRINEGQVKLRPGEVNYLEHLYAAQLNLVDRKLVAPFLDDLKQLGLYESSLVVVTGDHGEELYDHGSYAHGNNLYEETIHTPLILKFPGSGWSESRRPELLVESLDLSASLVDYAGGNPTGMAGKSFLPVVRSDTPAGNRFNEAYAQHPEGRYLESSAIVRWPWKLLHDYTTGKNRLYNLRTDPGETSRVTGRQGLKKELERRIFETVGSDSVPDAPSVSLREASSEELENLKGLGYVN